MLGGMPWVARFGVNSFHWKVQTLTMGYRSSARSIAGWRWRPLIAPILTRAAPGSDRTFATAAVGLRAPESAPLPTANRGFSGKIGSSTIARPHSIFLGRT
jgi:hypothetical protein